MLSEKKDHIETSASTHKPFWIPLIFLYFLGFKTGKIGSFVGISIFNTLEAGLIGRVIATIALGWLGYRMGVRISHRLSKFNSRALRIGISTLLFIALLFVSQFVELLNRFTKIQPLS
jgi:hypothetical protein